MYTLQFKLSKFHVKCGESGSRIIGSCIYFAYIDSHLETYFSCQGTANVFVLLPIAFVAVETRPLARIDT